jgi:hypothetical protein
MAEDGGKTNPTETKEGGRLTAKAPKSRPHRQGIQPRQ